MNISKAEQRTLHVLAPARERAQIIIRPPSRPGGAVLVEKDDKRIIVPVNCVCREGWTLADCTLGVFRKLKRKRFIAPSDSDPYRVTLSGRMSVRAQADNRA